MVKRRVSILRNKKGHPIYSREDIREQYCINKKEIEVLESGKSAKLFGCLTDPHESSPCTRNSILFSCLNKKRSSSDENVYVQATPGKESAQDQSWPSPYGPKTTKDSSDYRTPTFESGHESGDDEYALSGFRKRPKSFCHTDPRSRPQRVDSEASEYSSEVTGGFRRRKLESSASLGSTSQQSFDSDREFSRSIQRPSQLIIDSRGISAVYFQPSRSVDELNDVVTTSRKREEPSTTRTSKTPDILLDDRRQKHVSFDNNSLVRSNTIGGGLEDVDIGPAATSTPLNIQRRAFSPPTRNRSHERLLERSVKPLGEYSGKSSSAIKIADFSLGSSSSYRGSLQHRSRRALMKTQATQTELTFRTRFMLPAYLTLSPRATSSQQHIRHREKGTRHRSNSRLTKSKSAYGVFGSDESEEDVMEVDLVGKHHRLLRSSTARASIRRQKAIDTSQEEIMVSFKPAISPPKVHKEVLIGDRPLPRSVEKERRTAATPYKDVQEDFSERVKAVEIVVKTYRGIEHQPLQSAEQVSDVTRQTEELSHPPESASKFTEVPTVRTATKSEPVRGEKPSPEDSSEVSGEHSPSGRLIRFKPEVETMDSSSAKSSSGSSKLKTDELMWVIGSSSQGSEEFINHSEESPTVTTENDFPSEAQLAQESANQRRKEYLEKYHQINSKSQALFDNLTSPDSESSSSLFTERETSRSEVSTSSSNKVKSGSSKSGTEQNSGSSDYVTATEPGGSIHTTTHTVADVSFESASSASHISSPSSAQQISSSSFEDNESERRKTHQEGDTFYDVSESDVMQSDDADGTPTITSKLSDFGDVTPPLRVPEILEDQAESSDESTKKETSGPEDEDGNGVPSALFLDEAVRLTSSTPESDRAGNATPVMDPSPEPLSSLQDPQTVIEIKSETTSDELMKSINGSSPALPSNNEEDEANGSDHRNASRTDAENESESTDSSSIYSGQQELEVPGLVISHKGLAEHYVVMDHKASDELSTVSEVSEESSRRDMVVKTGRGDQKAGSRSSPSETGEFLNSDDGAATQPRSKSGEMTPGELEKKSSSSEYIPSENTTPSFDSTTSGSFVLENGSGVEYESSNSFNGETGTHAGSLSEKSAPEISEVERPKSDPVWKYSDSSIDTQESILERKGASPVEKEEDPPIKKLAENHEVPDRTDVADIITTKSSKGDEFQPSETPQSSMSFSSSSTHRSYQEDSSRRPPLSTWCSEGAIPKQRHKDVDTSRRRERTRNRSEERNIPASIQLVLPERQYSRSKSRSPEKSEEDLDHPSSTRVICSQCGEKIKEHGPSSAPPPGMWERQYQKSFWELPPAQPSSSPHLDHHQSYLWRQRERERLSGGYGDIYGQSVTSVGVPRYAQVYSVSQARLWSEGTATGLPTEIDIYPDDDEDAGIHSESYRAATWIYVSDSDELAVWKQPVEPEASSKIKCRKQLRLSEECPVANCTLPRRTNPGQEEVQSDSSLSHVLSRSDSVDSTSSEHEFLKQYQAVTHRMIHRKSSVEMYRRLAEKSFEVDKRVTVQRNNGEFGFRIHGSKPVVVSAIERGTPAETCGLEVGDIIVSINSINVLDASHSEVVRIAHTGTEVLRMEVTRTCHVLAPKVAVNSPATPVFSGFLQRLSVGSVSARRWCRRWFIIRLNGVLYWYRTPRDHEPLGALVLQNQSISRVPDAGSPHAFKLSKLGGCPHYFSADDEETASRWISALNEVAATASRLDPYMEQSVQNAKLPTTLLSSPDCQGVLGKLSQRWKSWKRRYFLLKDASLYFYADRNAKVALGIFYLHGYKVQSCNLQGKKNTFEAIPPEPRLKHLYFLADSENEKKRWLAAMEYSIDRWIKVG